MSGTRTRHAVVATTLALVALSGCAAVETTAQPQNAFSIVVGDCLDDRNVSGQVTSLPIVPCEEPHDSEVFARTEADGTEFPGDEALEARLAAFCRGEAFTEFIGIPYGESDFVTSGYFPTAESWASGDREFLCTVEDPTGTTVGSLAGTAH